MNKTIPNDKNNSESLSQSNGKSESDCNNNNSERVESSLSKRDSDTSSVSSTTEQKDEEDEEVEGEKVETMKRDQQTECPNEYEDAFANHLGELD